MPSSHRTATMIYNTLLFVLMFGLIFSTSINIYLYTSQQQTNATNRQNLCEEPVLKDSKYCVVIREQLR